MSWVGVGRFGCEQYSCFGNIDLDEIFVIASMFLDWAIFEEIDG